jgi:FKBP-type peptidyl-prolyl cis-trans isomerase
LNPGLKAFAGALVLLGLVSCSATDESNPTASSDLVIEDVVIGSGAVAANGDSVTVHYVGTLLNGSQFDSSYSRNQPFTFRIGANQVIQGWERGVPGMRVGGKRRLTIPPSLGYGSQANGPIPANSTLRFEIDLLSIAGK